MAQTTGSAQERGTAGSQCKWPFVFLPRSCLQSPSYSVIYVDACISQSCPGGLNLSWCSSQSFQLEERLSQGGADLGSAGAALRERLPQLAPAGGSPTSMKYWNEQTTLLLCGFHFFLLAPHPSDFLGTTQPTFARSLAIPSCPLASLLTV